MTLMVGNRYVPCILIVNYVNFKISLLKTLSVDCFTY